MSPIRASERRRYPANWPAISARIRFTRAAGHCECAGECGKGHVGRCPARHGQPHPVMDGRGKLPNEISLGMRLKGQTGRWRGSYVLRGNPGTTHGNVRTWQVEERSG